ncbi:MAG TPA: hypothetical protein VFG06_06080 [Thermodesulfovibrionales bacterium]|nr:hypothetical protein [Thermodesulfovibrionales bacterium]
MPKYIPCPHRKGNPRLSVEVCIECTRAKCDQKKRIEAHQEEIIRVGAIIRELRRCQHLEPGSA